jgi:hypothetical protein
MSQCSFTGDPIPGLLLYLYLSPEDPSQSLMLFISLLLRSKKVSPSLGVHQTTHVYNLIEEKMFIQGLIRTVKPCKHISCSAKEKLVLE